MDVKVRIRPCGECAAAPVLGGDGRVAEGLVVVLVREEETYAVFHDRGCGFVPGATLPTSVVPVDRWLGDE